MDIHDEELGARIDDLSDDSLISIFTMCGAVGMVNGGCTCRMMASAALVAGERLFSSLFGVADGNTSLLPAFLLTPRSQLYKLVDRARSHIEADRQAIFSWAVAHGYSACVQQKLEAESDILRGRILNFRSTDGATPLFLATRHNRLEVARILLGYGVEINLPNPRRLPLLQACKMGNVAFVRMLVEAKAEILARRMPLPDGVMSPLQAAVHCPSNPHRIDCLRLICSAFKDEDERQSCCSRMAFLHACEIGDMPYLRVLTEAGVGVKPPREDLWRRRGTTRFDSTTPLLIAAQMGKDDVAEYLLASNIAGDINAVLSTNKTALYLCAERGNAHLAKTLLSRLASLDVQTCSGRSALFAAVEHCHEETVQVMSEFIDVRHITMRTKGAEGASPFMLAEKRGKTSLIIPMLEAYYRGVRRRQLLRSFGDVIDDATHPYLTQKVEQYRHLMFQNRRHSAPSTTEAPRTRHQCEVKGMEASPTSPKASSPRRQRPLSAPRLSRASHFVVPHGRKLDDATTLRRSFPSGFRGRTSLPKSAMPRSRCGSTGRRRNMDSETALFEMTVEHIDIPANPDEAADIAENPDAEDMYSESGVADTAEDMYDSD